MRASVLYIATRFSQSEVQQAMAVASYIAGCIHTTDHNADMVYTAVTGNIKRTLNTCSSTIIDQTDN